MDSKTVIIAVISLLICSIPLVMGRKNRKKRENAFINEIKKKAKNDSIQLTKYELCSNFIIGFNDVSNMFYFLNRTESGYYFVELNLADYINCELQQLNHSEGENGSKRSVLDQLFLKFTPRSSEGKIVNVEIYNRAETYALSGEIQIVKEWIVFLKNRFEHKQTL